MLKASGTENKNIIKGINDPTRFFNNVFIFSAL